MNAPHRSRRPQDPPAGRLGQRRLRRRSAPPCSSSASSSPRPATCAADERVLDVAAGNGNATLAAARRGARSPRPTTSPACSSAAPSAPAPSAWTSTFQVADVEALPFDDASFDAVLSTFGVMFAPDHAQAAAEMARVCRPGGRIGLANWTPEGFIGQLFKMLGKHLPPPAGVQPPSLLGRRGAPAVAVRRAAPRGIAVTRRIFNFRYRSAAHFIDVFRTWYGPVHKAFAALPADRRRGARARPDRAAERPQPRRRGLAGGAERVPRDRRHAALRRRTRGADGRPAAAARPALRLGPGRAGLRAAVAGAARRGAGRAARAGARWRRASACSTWPAAPAWSASPRPTPSARRAACSASTSPARMVDAAAARGRGGAPPATRASRAWTPRRSTCPMRASTSRCARSA